MRILLLKQSVNRLRLNETIDLTSSQWSLVLDTLFESNQTWYMKNFTAIQRICKQFVQCLVAWSGNNQDLCVCL
jgi:hypothetical protein